MMNNNNVQKYYYVVEQMKNFKIFFNLHDCNWEPHWLLQHHVDGFL